MPPVAGWKCPICGDDLDVLRMEENDIILWTFAHAHEEGSTCPISDGMFRGIKS